MPWREVSDEKAQWEFVRSLSARPGLFLQTPAWAKFQRALGQKTVLLGWFENEDLTGIASFVWRSLPLGWGYWLCSKGPLFSSQASQTKALVELYKFLRATKVLFLRLEPDQAPLQGRRTIDDDPKATTVVDLSASAEQLFARMHEKTRYNIRLAERKGLTFHWGGVNEFGRFWSLLKATARRENFHTHTPDHYRTMLELFGNEPLATPALACRLGLVEYQGELLAVSLVVACNQQATYLHGASSRKHHELMAPHLLHGAAMRELKSAGCLSYDLWGIQPQDGSLKSWAGFTRFKLGFGGQRFESPGTFDFPLSGWAYAGYGALRRFRRAVALSF
ncbi:MAG TPA: peptidoglycan bridge formation glycyltransferase FemA/FemB family protein [Patescibacteria group bacterium]|nr:peptidoglycan bridge formation glycyltransferase FemA/FemB family protein [Patescibacteria group bacterium]